MKKFLSVLVTTALVSVATQLPSQADEAKKNYVGVGATFIGDTTGLGVVSKIGVAENISVRPFVSILGSSGDTSLYIAGVSATYDFNLSNADLTPYAGLGYSSIGVTDGNATANLVSSFYAEVGADYNVSDSFTINGTYRYFFAGNDGGSLGLGVGYRF
ncbi:MULTISPECIES: outer membrane beta-barrel protein [unclassified Chamaesiphon]|uniref:outer membrane beta-barrel protein n=1 Tax=unclassified Chamaesiphon TaxID=2620921 RepID=UPI00286BEFCF|nr:MULTISPECIES: outer membrane beta-barrel protein [unclassified Chamaesiphon]